jgi:hypothetical protein
VGGGGSALHLECERCAGLHRHDRQKVILLTGHSLHALSFAMADGP